MGWEEEHYWKRTWNPPPELLANYQKASSPVPPSAQSRDAPRLTGTAFTQPNKSIAHNYQTQTQLPQQTGYYPPGNSISNITDSND